MTEYERIREKIAEGIYESHWRDGSTWTFEQAKQQRFMKTEVRRSYEEADEYLSYVEIRADDQSLPPNPYFDMADAMKGIASPQYCHAQRAREDMLKPDSEGKHFVKVIPKKDE